MRCAVRSPPGTNRAYATSATRPNAFPALRKRLREIARAHQRHAAVAQRRSANLRSAREKLKHTRSGLPGVVYAGRIDGSELTCGLIRSLKKCGQPGGNCSKRAGATLMHCWRWRAARSTGVLRGPARGWWEPHQAPPSKQSVRRAAVGPLECDARTPRAGGP